MNNEQASKIERQVMASVAVIYTARKLLSFQAIICYALIISIFCISLLVSVPHVLENFSSVARGGLPSVVTFLGAAVAGTTLIVQLGLLVAIFALGSLLASFFRSFGGRALFA
jgi:hypothetical protein